MNNDAQHVTVQLSDGSTYPVLSGELTMDENWTPYIQAQVVIPAPPDLTLIEPRDADRVIVILNQQFSGSDTFAELSALYAGATFASLSGSWAGKHFSDMTTRFDHPWNAAETRAPRNRQFDLMVRSRTYDAIANTVTLALASDEALLTDTNFPGPTITPGGAAFTVRSFINALFFLYALKVRPISLAGTDQNAPPILGMQATQGPWDAVEAVLTPLNMRLWCDEQREWHLETRPAPSPGSISVASGTNLTKYSDSVSREGTDPGTAWYNQVSVIYHEPAPSTSTYYDIYPARTTSIVNETPYAAWVTPNPRTLVQERNDTPYPGPGAAQLLYNRAIGRGRVITLGALNDFAASPSMALAVALPDGSALAGFIQAITFDFATAEMSITPRDLV